LASEQQDLIKYYCYNFLLNAGSKHPIFIMLIDFRQVTNLNTLGRYATQLKVIFLLHVCPVISQLMSSRPTSLERNFPLALTNTCILLMVHTPRIRTLTVQRLKFSVIGLLRILTPMLSQCFHCPVISHAHNRQAFIPFLSPS
jgi:hypothetical protein